MKELIYVTGKINFSFFVNEIVVMRQYFDSVYVLGYGGEDEKKCNELAKKYDFEYDFVLPKGKNVSSALRFITYLRKDFVKEEIDNLKSNNRFNYKNKAYIYYYLWYASIVDNLIEQRFQDGKDIYLYSFWLSRPAFSIALLNMNRPECIKKIVSRTHRYDLYEEENKYKYLPFRRLISKNLDEIFFTSRDSEEYFSRKNYSGQNHAKYTLSYLGTQNYGIKKVIDPNKKEIVVASCANMIQRKRHDLIIKFLKASAFKNYSVKWLCIGDGEQWENVKKQAYDELINIKVEFTGRVEDSEIYDLYRNWDVDFFINMSDSEGVPVSIMEAISMGIPAIARRVGGNADIVNDQNGFLIEKGNIKSEDFERLASSVVKVFENKINYKKMSDAAYKMWLDRFSTENNTGKMCKKILNIN